MRTIHKNIRFSGYAYVIGVSDYGCRWTKRREITTIVFIGSEGDWERVKNRQDLCAVDAVTLDGSYKGKISISNISMSRLATSEEIEFFDRALKKSNLCVKDVERTYYTTPNLSGEFDEIIEASTAVAIHRVQDIKLCYEGKFYNREEAEKIELPAGCHYADIYNNGYSYHSQTKRSKEKHFKAIDGLLNRLKTGAIIYDYNGIQLVKKTDGSGYYIPLSTCWDNNYEITNS